MKNWERVALEIMKLSPKIIGVGLTHGNRIVVYLSERDDVEKTIKSMFPDAEVRVVGRITML